MTRPIGAIVAAAAALALSDGRLSAATPPNGGSISIELDAPGANDAVTRAFVDAARQALAARGFTVLEGSGHAAYVAALILHRETVGTGLAVSSTGGGAVTPGGALGSVGAGVAVPLGTGKSELVALQRSWLEVHMRKRGEAHAVWDGAAVAVRAASTQKGAEETLATDLSEAILRSYPAEPDGVVGVP